MRGDNQAAAGDVVLLLAVLLLLLLAQAAASSSAAAAVDAYSGRVVISYAHHRHAASPTADAAALMRRGRLLEDEVAPELAAGMSGWTPGPGGGISNSALKPDRAVCPAGNCAAGAPYTNQQGTGCLHIYGCRH